VRPEVGLERINKDKNRKVDRLGLEKMDFHQLVYQGYQESAKKHAHRIKVIDGERNPEEIVADIYNVIKLRLSDEQSE